MNFGKRFGEWVIICDEHQGAVSETAVGNGVNDGNNISIADALPRLH